MSKIILFFVILTGCSMNSTVHTDRNVIISPRLSALLKKKMSHDKFFLNKNLKMILLMHILYDSLGRTQIIVTPTSSSSIIKDRAPTFISKIDDKIVLIYNSNDEFLIKKIDYDECNKLLLDSVLSGVGINKKVYGQNIIRIKFDDSEPYIDSLSKTLPPIGGVPPKYPPIPIIAE